MAEQPTCGQGLASQVAFPQKVAVATDSFAAVLEFHMTALDQGDEAAQREHEVYRQLANLWRQAARDLQAAATTMVDSRDLPMGRHDLSRMQSDQALQVFEDLVAAEKELLRFLEGQAGEHAAMLRAMRGGGSESR